MATPYTEVRYLNDGRYPGPSVHPLPANIEGTPTQVELDAYPRMFTWGELKETIRSGKLERLMRNKMMQERYDVWMTDMKKVYGNTGASPYNLTDQCVVVSYNSTHAVFG